MANIGNKMASVTITLNGVQETIQGLDNMKNRSKELRQEMAGLKNDMALSAAAGNGQLWSQQAARFSELTQEQKKLQAAIREGNKAVQDMNTLMQDLDKKTLKQLQADLKTAKSKFRVIDAADLENLNKGKTVISQIQAAIAKRESGGDLARTLASVRKELGDLKTAPLERLRDAQKRLNDAIATSRRDTAEYKKALEQLKSVNKQIDSVTSSFQQQDSMISKTMKRLASYVAVYMGFNQLIGKAKEIISGNIALSDSIADIQKVTKMTTDQVDALAKEIDALDTRSAQEQLYQLGYQAGMLGLKSTEDILGFIKAADQMNWALKELGEDGAVQLMKVANLTHETDIYGVEEALTRVGSAINEITASSASSAAPIVDYVSRLGSVGATAGYTSSQLVAIGSTLDSLAVPAERGSTAISKFITSLQTNRVSIAESLGMSYKDLEEIEATRGSIGMMVEVLERLKKKGAESDNAMAILKPMFKEFGGEGERLVGVMTTLIQNVDTFKEHIDITSTAFEEGTSMLNEFMVKNETAAATFARLGNAMRETFVNSSVVRWLQDVGKYLVSLIKHSEKHLVVIGMLRSAIGALMGYMTGLAIKGVIATLGAIGSAWSSLLGYVNNVTTAYKVNYEANLLLNAAQKTGTILTKEQAIAQAELAVAEGTTTVATFSLTAALKALWAAMASNPLTAILALVGALVGAFSALGDAIWGDTEAEKDHQEALKETERWLLAERSALDKVHEKLEEARNDGEKRKRLIAEINDKYKSYLPKLLDEAADYKEIERALEAVNKQLSIKAALQMKEKLDQKSMDRYADAMATARDEAASGIDVVVNAAKDKLKDNKTMEGLRAALSAAVSKIASEGGDMSSKAVQERLGKLVSTYTDGLNAQMAWGLRNIANDAIIPLANATATYNQELKDNEKYSEGVLENNMSYAEALQKNAELLATQQKAESERAEQARRDATLIKDITSQQNKQLADWYDQLKDLGTLNTNGVNFRDRFEELFGSEKLGSILDGSKKVVRSKAQAIISDTAETIKKELASRGLTPELSHKSPGKEHHTNPETKLKKDVQEAFNYLKAFYNEEEAKWLREREQHPDIVTPEVTEDRIRKTKEQYELAFKQLSQFLLKQSNEFIKNQPVIDYFGTKNVDVTKLRDHVQKDGKQIWDDITKNMTDAERKQLDSIVKHLNEMQKIIEKYDFVAQAERSLQDGLVKNQLYYEEYYDEMKSLAEEGTALTAESLQERYHINAAEAQALLVLLSDYHDSYLDAIRKQNERVAKLTKQGYKQQETEWNEYIKLVDGWAKQMKKHESAMATDNKYSLELEMQALQLREAAQKEYIDVLRQQLTEEWALRLGYNEQILEETKRVEDRKAELRASSFGGEDIESIIANDPEILASQARIQAMRDEIDERIALSSVYQDAIQKLTEIHEEEANKQIEIEDRQKEAWQKYQDIIRDGAEDIGEKLGDLFSSDDREKAVENLREAGKDILKELTKQTMQMVQQWIMRKIQKAAIRKAELLADKAADAAEVASDKAKNLAISTGNASTVISKLTTRASETTAEAEAGISKGTSNAMSIGPWGSALVPIVISLITGALITGISAIGKAKQEVTAETGVSEAQASSFAKKKVAAGMFTYAEGRYPVLANDGNTYNARYENRLRTGLYDKPHFAVFGEKGMEMVIDGQTTDRMLTFRPDLYKDIISLRDGNIRQRARAYADGYYPVATGNSVAGSYSPSGVGGASGSFSPSGVGGALSDLTATLSALHRTLESGIYARLVEDFSDDGPINRMEQDRKWMQEHGLLKD